MVVRIFNQTMGSDLFPSFRFGCQGLPTRPQHMWIPKTTNFLLVVEKFRDQQSRIVLTLACIKKKVV
jgi:hypothetical protein